MKSPTLVTSKLMPSITVISSTGTITKCFCQIFCRSFTLHRFFESRNEPSTDPLVLWMTGGPGCSSELAAVFENGPYVFDENQGTPAFNPHSWNNNASVIYIDQPYQVGYSYTDDDDYYIDNEAEVGAEMWKFMLGFLEKYPQFAKNDFYITGESFGGHYVPAFGAYVVEQMAQGNDSINLKGIAVGNGWVSPKVQYGAYGPFGYDNGLITEDKLTSMNSTFDKCSKLIDLKLWDLANAVCSELMQDVLNSAGNINIYNIKEPCTIPGLCYNFTSETAYFNRPDVQKQLNVFKEHVDWEVCNMEVNEKFAKAHDVIESTRSDIPKILAAGLPVLIYNGKYDLICNWVGGDEWTSTMQWPGQEAFNAQKLTNWMVDGKVGGQVRSAQNLTFLAVEAAGHMVPHDQPVFASAMINAFISGTPIA
jgi:carboxypeptidase C (cathepsin A)